ncbi:MAG: MutS-related protein [Acidimicrobiales bacterium]|jgi:DNA mismatch repair protein MutS
MTLSLLYPDKASAPAALEDRRFAIDLELDQVFATATSGREDLRLMDLFYAPLRSVDQVAYRHEVLADLELPQVAAAVRGFLEQMGRAREILSVAGSLHTHLQTQRLFLDAVLTYCGAVASLAASLSSLQPPSRALRAFGEHLANYEASPAFKDLGDRARELVGSLSRVRYKIHIRGTRVTVSAYQNEPDYAKELETTFAKFRQEAPTDYTAKLRSPLDMNQVEARVLESVALLYPEPFSSLADYFALHKDFMDPDIVDFERAAQFYLAYLERIAPLQEKGLAFCYPRVSLSPAGVHVEGCFDLALALKAASQDGTGPAGVVTNDFELSAAERVIVVTGPNSGGKTTFCRAAGQVHYLASLGLPVPARSAEVVLADNVLTSFVQAEALEVARSHLEDELFNLHNVIGRATPQTVVIMNESFSSTTLADAAVIGKAVLAELVQRGALGVYVTFVEELASGDDAVVSMGAIVDPQDPMRRTYRFVRKEPEGRAYAALLAERYGLSFHAVTERVAR